jgi:alpha-galactosidase
MGDNNVSMISNLNLPIGKKLSRRHFLGGLAAAGGLLLDGGTNVQPRLPFTTPPASATVADGLALTPPMGWNPWNRFGADINETLIRHNAEALVRSGMKAAGYQYVIIDDGWAAGRDNEGRLKPDPKRFPSGIKALADYVHGLGLKIGLYTNGGAYTCTGGPGSLMTEDLDAMTFASWGIDYVKIDWCHTDYLDTEVLYRRFANAVTAIGRPMVLSIGNWGYKGQWDWCLQARHLRRTTPDIEDKWETMTIMMDINARYAAYAGPGRWNDPDMLETGNGGMTDTEYRSQVSIWAMMAAPLIAGNDLTRMSPVTLETLTNPNIISIDQDPAGIQGTWVADDGYGHQVWLKPLQEPGVWALALFNRRSRPSLIEANFRNMGIKSSTVRALDLWNDLYLGYYHTSFYAEVPAHGTVVVKVYG